MSETRDLAPSDHDAAQKRAAFYQLFEDVVHQLNIGARYRMSQGCTQKDLAVKADQDPGFLSRILSGNGGTNLRSIGSILYALNGKLDMQFVPLDDPESDRWVRVSETITLGCRGQMDWVPIYTVSDDKDSFAVMRTSLSSNFVIEEGND